MLTLTFWDVRVMSEPQMQVEDDIATVFVIVQRIRNENGPLEQLILSKTKVFHKGEELVRGSCLQVL